MRVAVVIVNYNGIALLPDCLDGLEAQTRAADEVIVVDNASSDESAGLIRRAYPWVSLVELSENLGFAGGNNVGIRASSSDVVVLINNDTVPSPGFVESIVSCFDADEMIAAVAGVMLFSNHVTRVATTGIEVYENGLALDHNVGSDWRSLPDVCEVFGPSGGAAAYRRSALDAVDLFPEPFFLYLEDVDLAWRLRLRGYRSVSCSAAWVHHVYSASAVEGSSLKNYYLARNRAWGLIRYWPTAIWRRNWWRVLAYEVGAIAYALLTRRWSSIRGRFDGWSEIARLLRSRARIQRRTTEDPAELLYWMRSAPSVRNIFRLQNVVRLMTRSTGRSDSSS